MPFDATAHTPWAIPFAFTDYLELVDWTGRALRSDKRGHIPAHQPKILDLLGIDGERFIAYAARLLKEFGTAVGAPEALVNLCARRQTKSCLAWIDAECDANKTRVGGRGIGRSFPRRSPTFAPL
jgi:hypothetical protein